MSFSGFYDINILDTTCHSLQQLYLFGGLLVISAIANVQPLGGRLSQLGAAFNFIGQYHFDVIAESTLQRLCSTFYLGCFRIAALNTLCLSVCISVCPPAGLSAFNAFCLSVHPSIHLLVCLSVCPAVSVCNTAQIALCGKHTTQDCISRMNDSSTWLLGHLCRHHCVCDCAAISHQETAALYLGLDSLPGTPIFQVCLL